MQEESSIMPDLMWVVAGKKGMELHAFDRAKPKSKPIIVCKTASGNWNFTIEGVDGSGRVRVGRGCNFNPLQMMEALYGMLLDKKKPDEAIIEGSEITNDMMKKWSQSLGADWE